MKRRLFDPVGDYDQVLAMHRLSWQINFPGRRFDRWTFENTLRVGVSRGEVWAYELDGALVAWLWLGFPRPGQSHVKHVQVAEPYWGQGIGRRVLTDAMRIARSCDCRTMTLTVTKSNRRAVALYEHLGFALERDEGLRQRMRCDLTAVREADDLSRMAAAE